MGNKSAKLRTSNDSSKAPNSQISQTNTTNNLNPMDDKKELVVENLEWNILMECLTESDIYPNLDIEKIKNKLLEGNQADCVRFIRSPSSYNPPIDSKQREYIKKVYLKKLTTAINKINDIKISVKCKEFDINENENKSIVKFDNIDQSSIVHNHQLNKTFIEWNKFGAQKPPFVYMRSPLICLLGISEFKGLTCSNLGAVKYDMIALRRLFEDLYGFKVIQKNERMIWDTNQIKEFFNVCIKNVLQIKGNDIWTSKINKNDQLNGLYDGMIIIISTHGGENEVIFDSYENSYNLHTIYKQFGSDYPALLSIPRIFIIDACRGNDTNTLDIERTNATKDTKQQKELKHPQIQLEQMHKGSNRVTLFGNSPGLTTMFSFNEDSQFGCSYFIRYIINAFRQYEKNTNELFTPTLSEILSSVQYNLSQFTDGKQLVYKNGDVRLDHLKIFKKKIFKNKKCRSPHRTYKDGYLHAFYQHARIFVRWYKNIKEHLNITVTDTSNMTLKQITDKLNLLEIEEQFPIQCSINELEVIPDTNGEILYTVKPEQDIGVTSMKIRLNSIICSANEHRKFSAFVCLKQYGLIDYAINHRFVKIEIINNCSHYNLKLRNTKNDCYLEECKFLDTPIFTVLHNGGQQIFFMTGNKLQKDDPFYYNELCENGIVCVLKYKLINKDTHQPRKGKNNLIIAIRTCDIHNKLKDLPKPICNVWICTNNECKNIAVFLNKLNDNIFNYRNKTYLRLAYHPNYKVKYWHLSCFVDVDAISDTQYYDNQNGIFLIFGYLRNKSNNMINIKNNIDIVKCICSYFSINSIYGIGRNEPAVFGIGKVKLLNQFTKLIAMSCLLRFANNNYFIKIRYDRIYIQTQNNELYVCGLQTDELENSGLLKKMNNYNNIFNDVDIMNDGLYCNSTFFINKINENVLYQRTGDHVRGLKEFSIQVPNINKIFNGSKLIQIACGESHCILLCDNGKIWAMGNKNTFGQCGLSKDSKVPFGVPTLINIKNVDIIKIQCATNSTLCIDDNYKLWVFGSNEVGTLGMMNIEYIYEPLQNNNINDESVIDIKCGSDHSLCLTKTNKVFLFGCNNFGQIGNGNASWYDGVFKPYLHKNVSIKDASLGIVHTVLLSIDSSVLYTFGNNEQNQCSANSKQLKISKPYKLTKSEMGLTKNDHIKQIFAGRGCTLIVIQESILKQDNNIFAGP